MIEPTITECHRTNLCVDCDDKACSHHGDIGADCPKWKCDNNHDCEHCEWIKAYTKLMRGNKDNGNQRH